MSNRDNNPELDYFELRRRHDAYKSRARAGKVPSEASVEKQPEDAPVQQRVSRKAAKAAAPAADTAADQLDPSDAPIESTVEDVEPQDPLARLVEMDEEEYGDDMEEEDSAEGNPNPFDSFIHFFHGIKGKLAARKEARETAELDALGDLSDEELAALDSGELDDPGDFDSVELPADTGNEGAASKDAPEIVDVPVSRGKKSSSKAMDDALFDEDAYGDDEYDDDTFEEGAHESGLKKFMSLFVTRVEDSSDAEEDEADMPVQRSARHAVQHDETSEDEFYNEFIRSVHSKTEGGQEMDEMNKPVSDSIQEMTEGLETSGMSRRERRERAQRLAAEEAARKAAEASKSAVAAPLFEDELPLNASTDESASIDLPIIETPAAAADEPIRIEEGVDEPTREFTPVSMRDVQENAVPADPFAVSDDEDVPAQDDDDADMEEDEEEEKPRRGLFGRRKPRYDEDDADDEDMDDEDDEEDADDEDDDDVRPARKSRGLFGRRKRAVEEDEDDEDEYDDEDDEYDEYEDDDEYDDDDYDDEDDEYDDDVHYPISHHIFGVLKWIVFLLILLVLAVLGLNFLYASGSNFLVPQLHEAMGDTAAFHLLFPKYEERTVLPETTVVPELTATPAVAPTATVEPQSTVAIPDLDSNGDITETPVVNVAPVTGESGTETQSVDGAIG